MDIMTYDFDKQADILDIGDTYQRLNSLSTDRPAGIYEIGMSITWKYDRTASSVYFRYVLTNGGTWHEFIKEPTDITDVVAEYYSFPIVHDGGPIGILLEARKETSANSFDILYSDVWVERKN